MSNFHPLTFSNEHITVKMTRSTAEKRNKTTETAKQQIYIKYP